MANNTTQSGNIRFQSIKEVESYAIKQNKTLLILDQNILDVTTFSSHHPGGSLYLLNKQLQNIVQDMKFHHPLTLKMANSMIIGSFKHQIKHILNPDQPLLAQMWRIKPQNYTNLINSPHWLFQPSPRMFQSDFMEMFTHCKWYTVPVLPTCVILYLFMQIHDWSTFNLKNSLLYCFLGFIFFTFVQYSLHRFIFHSEDLIPKTQVTCMIHFLTHGIHHMLPNDPDRLVLPFPLYTLFMYIGYMTVGNVMVIEDPIQKAFFWSLFQVGYIIYDICHYMLHHIDTSKHKGGYFHKLQKYHNQHHFGGQQAGFGVSSRLWDIILNTGFKAKKS